MFALALDPTQGLSYINLPAATRSRGTYGKTNRAYCNYKW